jgi:transcription elongation factor GreA
MDNKEYLTKEKFEEFKKELEYLKNEKRKEVAKNLEYAKALGDLSENAEYHEAREAQADLEDRIIKLENIIKSAVIISSTGGTDAVNVGSKVTVEKDGKKSEYTIVGTEEANVLDGKISIRSPFGQAILGKRKGDTFSFEAQNGLMKYKIVSID